MSETNLELPRTMHIETEPEEAPPANREPSPREVTMRAIAERAEAARQAELAQGEIYDREATEAGLNFVPDEPDPEPVARTEPPPQPAPAAPVVAPQPAAPPQVHAVMLDGQQYHVTDQQYAELARLGMLANVALHQYQQPQQQVIPPQPAAPQPLADPDRIRETVRQIQYGGEDAAVQALAQLVSDVASRAVVPTIDQNAIVQRAVVEAQRTAQLASDTQRIQDEYPEIFADPQRTMLAKLNVDAIRDRDMRVGRVRPDIDVYREAGDAVYAALGKPRPGSDTNPAAFQAAPTNVQPRADVVERKRAAPRATQAIDLRATPPPVPRPPTGSDIVEGMRRARFQSPMR